jgi:hypothetical protein
VAAGRVDPGARAEQGAPALFAALPVAALALAGASAAEVWLASIPARPGGRTVRRRRARLHEGPSRASPAAKARCRAKVSKAKARANAAAQEGEGDEAQVREGEGRQEDPWMTRRP